METLLKLAGLAKNPDEKSVLFNIFTTWTIASVLYDFFIIVAYEFYEHTTFERIENAQFIVSCSHLATKAFNMRLRNRLMWKIITTGKEIWEEMSSDPKNKDILEKVSKTRSKGQIRLIWLYLLPGISAVVVSLVKNSVLDRKDWKPMFCIWNPLIPFLGEDGYWTIWLMDSMSMGYALILFLVENTALYVCCIMVKTQMMVLVRMLQSEDLDVGKCVRFHQKIIRHMTDVKSMFAGQMAVEILCSALQISPRGFLLIVNIKERNLRAFEVAFFFFACIGTPILICYCGHIVTEQSEAIFINSYQNNWYNLSVADRKSLYFLMLQASKIMEMEWGNMVAFNMEQLAKVLQGTYSYMTLLLGAT